MSDKESWRERLTEGGRKRKIEMIIKKKRSRVKEKIVTILNKNRNE